MAAPADNSLPSRQSSSLWRWGLRRVQKQFHPLKLRLEREPFYRFQSLAEVALAADWGFRLDVNRATVDDWLRLPGLSIHQARSLVALSRSGVQFLCLEDLAAALGIPPAALQSLSPVLSFCYYDEASLITSAPLNANTASQQALAQLPGVGVSLAAAIIQERQRRAFRSAADFQQRLHIRADLMEQLIYHLQF